MSPTPFSIEFFPPQTAAGVDKLRATRAQLAQLKPEFFSVTYGAGGSTQERTFETVFEIQAEGLAAAPHLSCVGATRDSIRQILKRYQDKGIHRIVALRGDLPSGVVDPGELRYANELVEFIRSETGDWFNIEVAAYPEYHPQARTAQADLAAFKRKVDAGANSAITQYFYNVDAYLHFRDECTAMGVDIPIVPGIMPIVSFTKLARFSDACGAEIPRWMRRKFESFGDDADAIKAFGLDVVTDLCARLIEEDAPGLHFYCMNMAGPTSTIVERLGLTA
ncbi:methylenetetrahydrofolate reductase [NAD(P)H] [Denitromonas iodatirespirans]|uniref:Methylenetetrahydrofolate reductase n=1 Tax=Denitromonas iodatirespirans TaxID=2795389 RepID=A0A944D924_DENI1|nr:methylenetetrahydrofolate reductase [NAD(P)H] [Denitromonas iodatirespirans]MBT0962204.1 methylenetetrahydrofolate reductase [NAD(P)H] [Denitromonas iodatirespirans]